MNLRFVRQKPVLAGAFDVVYRKSGRHSSGFDLQRFSSYLKKRPSVKELKR